MSLAVFFGALAAVVYVPILIYNSRYFVERRVAKWLSNYEATLRGESVEDLRDRILKCSYWTMTEKSSLRETDTVKRFFQHFEAEEYEEILSDGHGGDSLWGLFAAEISIGYRGRPVIMDYHSELVLVLRELRRRKQALPGR